MTKDVTEETFELAKETMTGDLRTGCLDVIRNLAKPWQQLTEAEQISLASNVEDFCLHAVKRAVRTIAADGRAVIRGEVEQVTFKDGIKTVIKVSKEEELRHALADAEGNTILMVVSDDEEYRGERQPADIDLDQPELDMPVADNARATAA